jgi:hypothetical protein
MAKVHGQGTRVGGSGQSMGQKDGCAGSAVRAGHLDSSMMEYI